MTDKKKKKKKTGLVTKPHKEDGTHGTHHASAYRAGRSDTKFVDNESKVVGGAEDDEEKIGTHTVAPTSEPSDCARDDKGLPSSSSAKKQSVQPHDAASVINNSVLSFRDQRALMSSNVHQEQMKEEDAAAATDLQISQELQQSPGAVHVVPRTSTTRASQTGQGSASQESDDDGGNGNGTTDRDGSRDYHLQQQQQNEEDQNISHGESLVTAHLVVEDEHNEQQEREQRVSLDEKVVVEAKVVNLKKYVIGILVAVVVVGVAVAVGVVLSVNRPSDPGTLSPTEAPSESMSPSESLSQAPTSKLDSELATLEQFFDSGTTPEANTTTRINAGKFSFRFGFVFVTHANKGLNCHGFTIRLERFLSFFFSRNCHSLTSTLSFIFFDSFH
mmetsp:Transcript_19045/g.46006  ORF Transcript_19045/g.46006 Transcript_19045/m.46006 type:complete len:388 (-) Transcript_19045:1472-2635(-)